MSCLICESDPCICKYSDKELIAAVALTELSQANTVNIPLLPVDLRIMSWNIERLGDTGNLGKHGGKRPQDVIEAIAKIIHRADPHICALIEVFTGAEGVNEVGRIFTALMNLCQGTKTVWNFQCSPGKGTGGLSDLDGGNRRDCEGYAVLYRSDLGIECTTANWLNIYGKGEDFVGIGIKGKEEKFIETGKGRSYIRDACGFLMHIDGAKFFHSLSGRNGNDLHFPIAVFHAPGPRPDLQRQETIKDAISNLFAWYASPEQNRDNLPNAFICADFNASEDADNLVQESDLIEVDYSFPGDLVYLSRLISLVTKVELLRQWIKNNLNAEGISFPSKSLQFIDNYFKSEHFNELLNARTSPVVLNELEQQIDRAENWFAKNNKSLKLTGVREAKKQAKLFLNKIMEERLKRGITNEQFAAEKNRLKLWKSAINAKTETKFSEVYWQLEEIEGAEFLVYYVDEDNPIADWKDVQALVGKAFEDEFEDQQAFLGSRNITTYTGKIVEATMQNLGYFIKNQEKLSIQESYETAFSSGVDTGFFESTSYDEKLKTTRRKNILLTGFAKNRNASPGSVLYSNYDQVLSRTDGVRLDMPSIVTVPVLDCVLNDDWNPPFQSAYLGCAYKDLKIPSQHRFFVKICASAKEKYKEGLPKKPEKADYQKKNEIALKVFNERQINGEYCCIKNCAKLSDIEHLHILQTYLSRSHAISDHEPVMVTAKFYHIQKY